MKVIVPIALFISLGFILAAGCIALTEKSSVNSTTTANFTPFSNTSDPGLNISINKTANISVTSKGSLRVSISGISYPANLSVVLDNETVGTVKPIKPLYLMDPEGNHSVIVCVDSVCEQENVMVQFGRYVNVDFSDRLLRDVEFPNPTAEPSARILNYYKNGNTISVLVEFINPGSADHTIHADLSVSSRASWNLRRAHSTINADKIVVKQNKLGYKHCTATGKTASFRQKLEGADEYVEGYGERIEYDTRAETVDFFVQARVMRGQDDVRGDRITYNTRTEVIHVSGNPRNITSPTKGRVRAVIQPKSNETGTAPKDAPLVIQSSPTLTSPKR